ncbi:MAG: hypothetical protein ACI4JM_12655 [Oscillospiraceae bacterium]
MTILIYIIIVIALLVPLTVFLALLFKSIRFLVENFLNFKNFIVSLKASKNVEK